MLRRKVKSPISGNMDIQHTFKRNGGALTKSVRSDAISKMSKNLVKYSNKFSDDYGPSPMTRDTPLMVKAPGYMSALDHAADRGPRFEAV